VSKRVDWTYDWYLLAPVIRWATHEFKYQFEETSPDGLREEVHFIRMV
jgi:hypothetical protein